MQALLNRFLLLTRSSTRDNFLIATYSFDSLFRAEMTEPYVPLPMSLITSYLTGNSNMIPLKSVHAYPGMFDWQGIPSVCCSLAFAAAY